MNETITPENAGVYDLRGYDLMSRVDASHLRSLDPNRIGSRRIETGRASRERAGEGGASALEEWQRPRGDSQERSRLGSSTEM